MAQPGADRLYESCPILYSSTQVTRAGEGGPRAAVGAPTSRVNVSVSLRYRTSLCILMRTLSVMCICVQYELQYDHVHDHFRSPEVHY